MAFSSMGWALLLTRKEQTLFIHHYRAGIATIVVKTQHEKVEGQKFFFRDHETNFGIIKVKVHTIDGFVTVYGKAGACRCRGNAPNQQQGYSNDDTNSNSLYKVHICLPPNRTLQFPPPFYSTSPQRFPNLKDCKHSQCHQQHTGQNPHYKNYSIPELSTS